MGISGNLKTMVLAELLQWLSMGQKTGTLKIDSKKVTKRIFFERGIIISSSSTDPNEYLGRFLVNHGYIPEERVNAAIARQKETKQLLGSLLIEMGDISEDDLNQMLRLKAEESIYDVFTFEEAAFEFFDNELPAEHFIRMELDVQWIVLEGTRRTDEWNRIKEVVSSPLCVPVLMLDPAQTDLEETDKRILEWIDDDRTVEEISQGAQISLFQVSGTIASAAKLGYVKVVRPRLIEVQVEVQVPAPAAEKDAEPTVKPGKEVPSDSGVYMLPMMQQLQQLYAMQSMMQGMPGGMQGMPGQPYQMMPGMMPGQMPQMPGQMPGQMPMQQMPQMPGQMPMAQPAIAPAQPVEMAGGRTLHYAGSPGAPPTTHVAAPPPASEAERVLGEAEAALKREDFEAALAAYRKVKSAPGASPALENLAKAGEDKIDQALEKSGIAMSSKPKLKVDMGELTKLSISPQEGYMLTRVDGTYDLKSILKIVPLNKVDAKILFWKLRKSGHVAI